MKVIVNSLILVLLISSKACTNNLSDKLQGEWRYAYAIACECPDFLLFHPNGRYIVFNDFESRYHWIPIVEKGDWAIKGRVIELTNREFIEPYAGFIKYHGSEPVLLMHIKSISEEKLVFGFSKDGNNYITEHYKRVERPAEIMRRYTGTGSAIEELVLPPPGGATILKLSYEFRAFNNEPSELIVKDQDGYEVFRKKIISTNGVEETEILLADMPRIADLTKLIFGVNARTSSTWQLKAEIY